jgi:hypothetical protein
MIRKTFIIIIISLTTNICSGQSDSINITRKFLFKPSLVIKLMSNINSYHPASDKFVTNERYIDHNFNYGIEAQINITNKLFSRFGISYLSNKIDYQKRNHFLRLSYNGLPGSLVSLSATSFQLPLSIHYNILSRNDWIFTLGFGRFYNFFKRSSSTILQNEQLIKLDITDWGSGWGKNRFDLFPDYGFFGVIGISRRINESFVFSFEPTIFRNAHREGSFHFDRFQYGLGTNIIFNF